MSWLFEFACLNGLLIVCGFGLVDGTLLVTDYLMRLISGCLVYWLLSYVCLLYDCFSLL